MGGKRGTLIKLFVANVLISFSGPPKDSTKYWKFQISFDVDGQWLQF